MLFRDLAIGQEFDWIDPDNPQSNSFFKPCQKISARKYRSTGGQQITVYTVGTINAPVFNVKPKG